MMLGYARVSTQEQETRAQIDALKRAGVVQIYQEKRSGADVRRPVLAQMLASIKPGDVLVVYKLDRIARSLRHLLDVLASVSAAGASFRSLTEVIDTASPAGRMMVHVLGAFAEFERALIRERSMRGQDVARASGVKCGRPRALSSRDEAACYRLWRTGRYTMSELAARYGCHLSSVKRLILRVENPQSSAVRSTWRECERLPW